MRRQEHDERNREAAEAILAHASRYGGAAGLCAIWARMFLERWRDERAGELFERDPVRLRMDVAA